MQIIKLDTTQDATINVTEDCEIVGLFIGKADQIAKSNVKIIHRAPGLKSNTMIKAVLYDNAKFEFFGDLIIEQGAKQTNTYLKIDVLMLSSQARAIAVPSLEIKENEVSGGHGATVGEIDEEQLFYLTTRGLSRSQAQEVIVKGFISDILEKLK